jgi:hypothetical protein
MATADAKEDEATGKKTKMKKGCIGLGKSLMSAYGTKRTSEYRPRMSAFGVKQTSGEAASRPTCLLCLYVCELDYLGPLVNFTPPNNYLPIANSASCLSTG